MRFGAVVTSHDNPDGLRYIVRNLLEQTQPPDEIIALLSGESYDRGLPFFDIPLRFLLVPNHNDWGHDKRARGLELVTSTWVGFFNDDDSYERDYIETMLAAGDNADVVYCAWNEQPDCYFGQGSSTSGNFIVGTELARRVGWNHRHYEADGAFIEGLKEHHPTIARVDQILYRHNEQP